MRSKLNTIGSTLGLLILAGLTTGCATGRVVGSCTVLPPPPSVASGDSAVDAWVDDLDRHYQKLDACRRA